MLIAIFSICGYGLLLSSCSNDEFDYGTPRLLELAPKMNTDGTQLYYMRPNDILRRRWLESFQQNMPSHRGASSS